ncbi:hypothetical protein [Leekyejoonella antrihumi]|uniref:Nitroreductase domain-containing protein n=1 Tax=Leekyejoonella antrihumi TaxID=1660198 RepID=A0A563DZZ8_9MICO|nr:hypothetical protein [Leekyejoonella antrihumi]TWP35826.1 hypothetical protein FGL98_12520 [Leekyejoonella antrihumi]
MTTVIHPQVITAVRRAAVRATLAPSIHNSQPWRFVVSGDALEIHIDPSRQLRVLDPRGHQVALSCGCALFSARAAMAACGLRAKVRRFPMGSGSTLAAVISVVSGAGPDTELAALDAVVEAGRTIRPAWRGEAVPPQLVSVLVDAASHEGAQLTTIAHLETRLAIARLPLPADRSRRTERIYGTGPQTWMSEELPQAGGAPPAADSDERTSAECLLLLSTAQDDPTSWLRAGESLQRILLEIARAGYAASPLAQVIELPQTNALLCAELGPRAYPNALLLVGSAVSAPQLRRRRLVDMLTQVG